jgi:hypothetical protein
MRESGVKPRRGSSLWGRRNLNHKRGTVGAVVVESGPISAKKKRIVDASFGGKQHGSATHRESEVETKSGRPIVK